MKSRRRQRGRALGLINYVAHAPGRLRRAVSFFFSFSRVLLPSHALSRTLSASLPLYPASLTLLPVSLIRVFGRNLPCQVAECSEEPWRRMLSQPAEQHGQAVWSSGRACATCECAGGTHKLNSSSKSKRGRERENDASSQANGCMLDTSRPKERQQSSVSRDARARADRPSFLEQNKYDVTSLCSILLNE